MFEKDEVLLMAISFILTILIDKLVFGKKRPKPYLPYEIILYSPVLLYCLSAWLKFSLYPIILPSGLYIFGLFVFLLAILSASAGYIDGLIHGFLLNNRSLRPYKAVKEFAKHGNKTKKGHYDISLKHVLYAGLCNITGASCSFALLVYMQTLPGFSKFLQDNDWTKYFELMLPVCIALTLIVVQQQQSIRSNPSDPLCENPDNFLLSRPHVLLNCAHLIFTYFYCFITTFYLITYAIYYWVLSGTKLGLSIQIALPVIAFFVFETYALGTEQGNRYGPEAAKGYMPAVIALFIGVLAIIYVLFSISIVHIIITILLGVFLFVSIRLTLYARSFNKSSLKDNILFYVPIVVAILIIGLAVLFNLFSVVTV
jgi:hypothetical protein